MADERITEKIKEIKSSFRTMMNGVAAQSMREKGLDYFINWGVSLPMLKEKALLIGKDYDLAVALWKENVRECKILAPMIMPPDVVPPEVIDIWMEQTESVEIAELASFNLYQHLPYAAEKAYKWIASEKVLYQLCGFNVLSRLFMKGQEPNERGINEYIDQLICVLKSENYSVKKAALSSVLHFSNLGIVYKRVAENALKSINVELF